MTTPEPSSDLGLTSRDTGRTTYVQVRTLVEHLQNQHRRLQETYRAQAENPGDNRDEERAALLYGYVAGREQGIESFLERLTDQERKRILDTWLQYGDPSNYDESVDALVGSPPENPREVLARLTELDRELASVYRRLENMADVPNVADFFRRLREVAEGRVKEHAENLRQVEDL